MTSLYSILELPAFSDIFSVKKNFKILAKKYHPDVNKNDPFSEKRFKRINNAYQILSDENKKRRYDEILRYQLNNPSKTYRSSIKPSQRAYRSPKKAPIKENKYYQAVTLAFFGLGIILFQIISSVNESRIESSYKNRIIERKELLNKSVSAWERKEFRNAFYLLNSIQFDLNAKDINSLRSTYLSFSDSVSNLLITEKKYDSALYHLEILLDYTPKVDANIYTRMSDCYRSLGRSETAISILNNLLLVNPSNLIAHRELANIYNQDLGDYVTSLDHYELATKIIVQNYIRFYGKAYIAIINPKNHPKSDHEVFLEKAKIYYNINQIDSSLTASRWASFLAPENAEAHLLQGLCWLKKGDSDRACLEFDKARSYDLILPKIDSLLNAAC